MTGWLDSSAFGRVFAPYPVTLL